MLVSDFKENLCTVFLTSGFFWGSRLGTHLTSGVCSGFPAGNRLRNRGWPCEQAHSPGQLTAGGPPIPTGLQCLGLSSRSCMSSCSTVSATGLWMHPSEP